VDSIYFKEALETDAPRLFLELGHIRRGTNVKPEVDGGIAARRLNRLAQVL
jgi:hypothetical protein